MADQIGSAVVDSFFVVVKREIGYMWNCSENVEKLRHEAEKLKVIRGRVQELIDISIRRGDRLSYGVEDWVKEADTEISKADEFLQQEANAKIGLCGNWGTLHHCCSSKNVAALMKVLSPRTLHHCCIIDDLHTQNAAFGDIIKSLEDESIQITGIYGLGGVGKTTLAKEVAARVKKTNLLFADVAFTTVSQTVDAKKIQNDLENATKRTRF